MEKRCDQVIYSAVVPVYNEERNIEPLYKRLRAVMDKLGSAYEIIFINDGSGDGSRDILESIAAEDTCVTVLNFKGNFGQHPAVTAGLLEAAGRVVITLDADLQNPPEEIPKLLNELENGYDMVAGKRESRKDSFIRKVPSSIANLVIGMVTGVWMRDYGSMLRVFRSDTAKMLAREYVSSGSYITMIIPKITKNVKEVNVTHDERYSGVSKYGFWKLMGAFFRIFLMRKKEKGGHVREASDVFCVASVVKNGKKINLKQDE